MFPQMDTHMSMRTLIRVLLLSGYVAIAILIIILANQPERSGDSTTQKRESIMRLSIRPNAVIR